MKLFLQLVADDLIERYGRDLSHLVVVFPNKRARLFLGEHLAKHGTVWAPQYTTISELFCSMSDVTLNDRIDTVCRMHRIYCELTGSDETLDVFYGWGERLLADFDDTDKNLVDAQKLFTNVKDYKSIDFGDFMNEDEKRVIKNFFQEFDDTENSRIKDNFLKLWNHMYPIYKRLNEELLSMGMAYEGGLQRRCLEQISQGQRELPPREETAKWIFVGFNVLDKVEHELMSHLQSLERASFYWDYDKAYVNEDTNIEAGEFMRQNLRDFPNELGEEMFENMGGDQEFEFVAAPTENSQAFHATQWLNQHYTPGKRNTAIVLCNEAMLEPVLHVLPDTVKELNVTKGFPLTHTAVYTRFMQELGEAEHRNPELSSVEYLDSLLHFIDTYAKDVSSLSAQDAPEDDGMMQILQTEACFRIHTLLERLRNIAIQEYFQVGRSTLRRLIVGLSRQTDIPFHGEPAVGLQIMGMLETRNLDFENILMLSVNEGVIPRPAPADSFIPYPLKAAYGLTLPRKKTAVYAYYFYRIIQRAKHVRFVFNSTANHIQTGEMSRYMTQLLLSQKYNISHLHLSSPLTVSSSQPVSVEKPRDLYRLITTRTGSDGTSVPVPLSPSTLNKYLDCPLQFYFSRVAHISKPQDNPDEMDNRHFGNLFHDAAEFIYHDAVGLRPADLKARLGSLLSEKDDKTLKRYILDACARTGAPRDYIAEATVLGYLKRLLRADSALGNLRIVGVEQDMYITIPVSLGGKTLPVSVGGRIDRLDVATNPDESQPEQATTLRVVDYKTGSHVHEAKDMNDIFHKEKNRPYYLFQTFLYALAVMDRTRELTGQQLPVSAVLFYPARYGMDGYSPWVKFGGEPLHVFTSQHASEFRELLRQTLEEILDPDTPFRATDNPHACSRCDFRLLCGKRG